MINPTNAGETTRRSPGRPRAFDEEAVVARATQVFWENGYAGTSIGDLTTAMGISAQSLYTAFGSKEQLHTRTLDWYATYRADADRVALDRGNAVDAIEAMLLENAAEFASPAHPPGCLVASGELAVGSGDQTVAEELARRRRMRHSAIRERIARGVADGDLDADADIDALSRFVATTVQGMSVQARDGASADELRAVALLAATTIRAAAGGNRPL